MARTRRWQAGAEIGLVEYSSVSGNIAISTTNPKTGNRCFILDTGSLSHEPDFVSYPATRQLSHGIWMYGGGLSVGNFINIVSFNDVSETALINVTVDGGGSLRLVVGGSTIGTASNVAPTDAWWHFGIDLYIHSSSGWVSCYVNGSLNNTLNISGNTGNSDTTNLAHGKTPGGNYSHKTIWDDAYLDDTTGESSPIVPPLLRFYPSNGNGTGTYSQFTPSAAVDHYTLIDDVPPDDDTTYIEATSADLKGSFAMTSITLGANEVIQAVIPYAYAKRTGSTEQIALGTRYSGVDVVGSDQDLGTSYGVIWERQTTKPGGGAWDQAAVDDYQTIVESGGTY